MQKKRMEEVKEDEKTQKKKTPEDEKEVRSGSEKKPKVPQELVTALQAITILASLKCGKAMEGGPPIQKEDTCSRCWSSPTQHSWFYFTLILRWMWDQCRKEESLKKGGGKKNEDDEKEAPDGPTPAEIREGRRILAIEERRVMASSSSSAARVDWRRIGGGSGPDPSREGRRRTPRVFITHTGIKASSTTLLGIA